MIPIFHAPTARANVIEQCSETTPIYIFLSWHFFPLNSYVHCMYIPKRGSKIDVLWPLQAACKGKTHTFFSFIDFGHEKIRVFCTEHGCPILYVWIPNFKLVQISSVHTAIFKTLSAHTTFFKTLCHIHLNAKIKHFKYCYF